MASAAELDVHAARARQLAGARLLDVRNDAERLAGMAEAAVGVVRDALEADPSRWLPDPGDEILLICAVGQRSRDCARALRARGYANVASIAGGTVAWQAAGLPMQREAIDADFASRYDRHLRLPEVGVAGQRRLQAARVLLIGAGGLGSPAALYLAAAGVGYLRIVDHDQVEPSNLQRQILHRDADRGRDKVASAAAALAALNPGITIEAIAERVDAGNVERLLSDVDVVLDGSDNFATRYLLNDACVRLGLPLVFGAVHRFDGQVSVFDAGRRRGLAPCYRCLFPEPPPPELAPNCAEAGVLGVLPGVIGTLQATEVLKLVLGIGKPLVGRLLQFDALAMRFRELRLAADPACPVCSGGLASWNL
jgi:molybdopterin/thiamine biosynthesis adenylyltransferase/rhodanese-related sulfurtransferase